MNIPGKAESVDEKNYLRKENSNSKKGSLTKNVLF
jgi:hypothetical protein